MNYFLHETCQIPHAVLQNIYLEVFGYKTDGIFVEVGAYDGLTYSNTCGFAYAGWRGLYIEADPQSASKCVENHRQNKKINVLSTAVGSKTGTCNLYKSKINGDSVSSILLEKTNLDWGCREDNYIEVPIDTLDNILKGFDWQKNYDLLVIDVEEAELEVLHGYSLDLFVPKMVIIEINDRPDQFTQNKKKSIYSYFSNSYNLIYSDHINSIFVRK